MASDSANMGLRKWDVGTDFFKFVDLYQNWDKVDQHDHTTNKGVQIPTGGIANLAVTGPKIADGAITTPKLGAVALSQSMLDTNLLNQLQAARSLQEGVIAASSFVVTQKSGGANMSVDVASNDTGAFVENDTTHLLSFIAPTVSATNKVIGSNSSGNPRIDQVVMDTSGNISVVAGTATGGATLDNRTGAAALPVNSIRLADVLVANSASTIPNSVIRDRRKWARGAHCRITQTTTPTRSSATVALVDGTNIQPRIECSGAPLLVSFLAGGLNAGAATVSGAMDLFVDGTTAGQIVGFTTPGTTSRTMPVTFQWEIIPAAGSHLIGPAWSSDGTNTVQLLGTAVTFAPLTFTVTELVRQNSANNTTTTG